MIQARSERHDDEAYTTLLALAWEGVQRAVVFFWTSLQTTLNRSNPRPYDKPSKPGEPPRKRTGWLQRNVLYELDQATLTGRVGLSQNAKYGVYLEDGTPRMAPRPWFAATLKKVLPQLQQFLRSQ